MFSLIIYMYHSIFFFICLHSTIPFDFFLLICSPEDLVHIDVMKLFPELFGCAYLFAESHGWNSEPPLKRGLSTSDKTSDTTRDGTKRNQEEHLNVPVQESQTSFTQPAANYQAP